MADVMVLCSLTVGWEVDRVYIEIGEKRYYFDESSAIELSSILRDCATKVRRYIIEREELPNGVSEGAL